MQRWHVVPTAPATDEEMAAIQQLIVSGEVDGEKVAEVEAKRRRFGRFVGLRGCESPSVVGSAVSEGEMRREMESWMENEMRRREARDAEERNWREKGCW